MIRHSHFCPTCGAPTERVHRSAADRWVSLIRRVHRYRCTDPACDWHGLLASDPQPAVVKSPALWRLRLIWLGLGAAIALAGTQAVRYHQRPAAEVPRVTQPGAQSRADTAPAGEDFHGMELPTVDDRVAANRSPLSLRRSCAWGVPGSNPYRGTVEQALGAAGLPAEVVREISTMVQRGWTRGQVEIARTGIRTVDQRRHFGRHAQAMGFGNVLCFDTRVNFAPGHVEFAALYEAVDSNGRTHSVMIPYVCQNVAVLGERGEAEEEEGASPTGGVAEPPGWAVVLFALAVLAALRRFASQHA